MFFTRLNEKDSIFVAIKTSDAIVLSVLGTFIFFNL